MGSFEQYSNPTNSGAKHFPLHFGIIHGEVIAAVFALKSPKAMADDLVKQWKVWGFQCVKAM
jgi:hypothetical protein